MTLFTVCNSRSVCLLGLCEGGQASFNREERWLIKMGIGMACELCYLFCKKGRNKILHFNVLLCVLRKALGSLQNKLRKKII